jgi:hypothetical protein
MLIGRLHESRPGQAHAGKGRAAGLVGRLGRWVWLSWCKTASSARLNLYILSTSDCQIFKVGSKEIQVDEINLM